MGKIERVLDAMQIMEALHEFVVESSMEQEYDYINTTSLGEIQTAVQARDVRRTTMLTLRIPSYARVSFDDLQARHARRERMLQWMIMQLDTKSRKKLGAVSADELVGNQLVEIEERFERFEHAHNRLTGITQRQRKRV